MKSPLKGKKILLTRPKDQNKEWAERLESLGAIPVLFPLIEITAAQDSSEIEEVLSQIYQYDWIVFTSINAARHSLEILNKILLMSHKIYIAAIGSKTAAYLEDHGLEVDFMPLIFTSANLADEIDDIQNKKILLPRTNIADDNFTAELRQRGATVKEITVYNTHIVNDKHDELQKIVDEGLDVITFASPSAVEAFYEMGIDKKNDKIACIGPVTADKATKLGLGVDIIADKYTTEGLTEAMLDYFENIKFLTQ